MDIIKVTYENQFNPRTFQGKAYTYLTKLELKVGDIVIAPTKYGESIARVSFINVPRDEIKDIEDIKLITKKINRDRFLNYAEIQEEVA